MQSYLKSIRFLFLMAAFCLPSVVTAQVFSGGRESAKVKYEQFKDSSYTLVYPIYYRPEAMRVSQILDSVAPYVSYGFKAPIKKFPIILYTSNQQSNGMVSFMPARDEMVMTPPVNMTATPWMKQLAIHEYRHVAQMSQLYSNVFKYGRWFLGDIGSSIGLLFFAKWYLEGDATNAETQLAEYGRGLQPDFTIEYRAMMTEEAGKPFQKWYVDNLIIGSYKYHTPDIYKFGYQMVRSFETKVASTYMGDFFDYATRRPYVITPSYFYSHKTTGSTIRKFAHQTFRELDSLWRPTYDMKDSFGYVTHSDRSYTQYSYPIALGDGRYIALKKSMDDPLAFVITDGNKTEKILNPGSVSSRPVLRDGKLYWTEYKPSTFYEYKNSSIIRSFDISSWHKVNYKKHESNYLLTPMSDGWAMVRYDSMMHGNICITDSEFRDIDTLTFPVPTSLHGLAYDTVSGFLCFIAVDDRGMWLGAFDNEHNIYTLKEPSAVTLSDLSASDGKLYFGSIQSGKDEIHTMNLRDGMEYRLTSSRLGSKQPMPDGDSVAFVGYSAKGWNVATTSLQPLDTVQWQRLPIDILNPKRVEWETARSFDTMPTDTLFPKDAKRIAKRYRRASKWFNFHSWIPGLAGDVDKVLEEYSLDLGFGATGLFQSPLGDFMGYMTLGSKNSMFWGVASIDYVGLPVKFTGRIEYGGGTNRIYATSDMEYTEEKYGEPGTFVRGELDASLPINISSYSTTRIITPLFSYMRSGDMIYNPDYDDFVHGLDRYEANVTYSAIRSYSMRSLYPRLGFSFKLGFNGAFHYGFGKLIYTKGTGYFPGFMKNHSIVVNAATQYQFLGTYNFRNKALQPTGITDDNIYQKYTCVKTHYDFPICYPEWGLDRYIFLNRLTGQLFYDYSIGIFDKEANRHNVTNYSLGFAIGMELSVITSCSQNLQFKIAFPNAERTFVGFTYSMSF